MSRTPSDAPMYAEYEKFYAATKHSGAFSVYCERVFGVDLTQDGFADAPQLHRVVGPERIARGMSVLDVGCGNGRIAEYLSDRTGARFRGIDYSPTAIAQALARTNAKRERLDFRQAELGRLGLLPATFDAILSVDTIFFGPGIVANLRELSALLKPGGRMFIFYPEFRFDPSADIRILEVEHTQLAVALRESGLRWTAEDLSSEHCALMRRKNRVGRELREDFGREGNAELCGRILQQSAGDEVSDEEFLGFSRRYLYIAQLP